jgi:hypothetical protein
MAQDFDNTNRGSIWKNERKESENHPDFTGSLNVGGVEYWVSAWKRKPDASEKAPALSFTVKPKDEAPRKPDARQSAQSKPQRDEQKSDGFEEEIPW